MVNLWELMTVLIRTEWVLVFEAKPPSPKLSQNYFFHYLNNLNAKLWYFASELAPTPKNGELPTNKFTVLSVGKVLTLWRQFEACEKSKSLRISIKQPLNNNLFDENTLKRQPSSNSPINKFIIFLSFEVLSSNGYCLYFFCYS